MKTKKTEQPKKAAKTAASSQDKNESETINEKQSKQTPEQTKGDEQVIEVFKTDITREGISTPVETSRSSEENTNAGEFVFQDVKELKNSATQFGHSKIGTPLSLKNKYGKEGTPLFCIEAAKLNEILTHVLEAELVAFMGQNYDYIPNAENILQHDSEQGARYTVYVDDYLDENNLFNVAELISDKAKLLNSFITKEHLLTAIAIQRSITHLKLVKKYGHYLPEPGKLLIEAQDAMEEILALARLPRRTSTIIRRKKAASESLPA